MHALLSDVARRLEHYADLAEAMTTALDAENVDAVLYLSLRARHVRDALRRADQQLDASAALPTTGEMSLAADIAEARARALPGDRLFHHWLDRTPADERTLLSSSAGLLPYIDQLLPAHWNFDEHVVLLVGNGLEDVATILGALGQQRLIAYVKDASEHGYSDDVKIASNLGQLYNALRKFRPASPRFVASFRAPKSDVSASEYAAVMNKADRCLRDTRVSRNTLDTFCETWLLQGIDNLPAIARWPSMTAFRDTFRGRPMVIVAPGPSLANNIDQLHRFVDRALIVCFSHSLAVVKAAGINPDLVVTVDSNALQYHFDDFPIDQVGAMISGVTVHPDLFDLPAPVHITMGANSTMDAWIFQALGENGIVTGGGSVATSALALGLQWGCDPIICIGSDLSFPGGKYYIDTSCDGALTATVDEDSNTIRFEGWSDNIQNMFDKGHDTGSNSTELTELRGYYGGMVPTSAIFATYHAWFEHVALEVATDTTLINATEGGAYIDGMVHIPLATAFEKHVGHLPLLDAAAVFRSTTAAMDLDARAHAVLASAEDMATAIRRSVSLAKRCAELTRKSACATNSSRQSRTLRRRLIAGERRLVTQLAKVGFIAMTRQVDVERAQERARHARTEHEINTAAVELFKVIETTAANVLTRLESALSRLRDDLSGRVLARTG